MRIKLENWKIIIRKPLYYGMCPDCVEKNKKQLTFCSHSGIYYKVTNLFTKEK